MLKLPFNVAPSAEYPALKIGDLEIPAYGSLTPNESLALSKLEVDEALPVGFYYASVVTIFAASRTGWIMPETGLNPFDDLPVNLLESAIEWVKSEQNSWVTVKSEETEKKPEIPTGEPSFGGSSLAIPMSRDSIPETSETAPLT